MTRHQIPPLVQLQRESLNLSYGASTHTQDVAAVLLRPRMHSTSAAAHMDCLAVTKLATTSSMEHTHRHAQTKTQPQTHSSSTTTTTTTNGGGCTHCLAAASNMECQRRMLHQRVRHLPSTSSLKLAMPPLPPPLALAHLDLIDNLIREGSGRL